MNTKPKILLVDDETEILEVVGFLLKREGFEIFSASNGLEALNRLSSESFSGVVCDFSMPKMNGLELLKKVRELHNFVPFIFLSGHAGSDHAHEMMSYGAFDVIQKPHIDGITDALWKLVQSHKDITSLEKTGSIEVSDFLEILHGKVS